MKSLNKTTFILLLTTLFISCNKSADSRYEILKERFHGKYQITSAVSSEEVDLNMDGATSINLLEENPEILNAKIEIRITEDYNLFEERWPNAYITVPRGEVFDSSAYHSTYTVLYALYAIHSEFQFSHDLKSIILDYPNGTEYYSLLVPFPESIEIGINDTLKVTTNRMLYTYYGWKGVKITAKYIRYQTTT
jgi:hypothetical protein